MTIHEALYTTRAMRRVKKDPIPEDVQARILDAAIRAPSGGNSQNWRFLLVDDPAIRDQLAPIYKGCIDMLWKTIYAERVAAMEARPDDADSIEMQKVMKSANWMANHFADYPILLFGFAQGDPTGGSIFPAIWSAMLAARADGVGSTITSVMMFQMEQVLKILGVPAEDGWVFAACVPMGYPTGRWGLARRRPVHEVAFRNQWGTPLGLDIPEPLWETKK
ncbi:MAG: nitroreductase family protein [Candidatus Binatia bacterium]|nr:nitroreductase family protein [Candidatus Binatia bacterium]